MVPGKGAGSLSLGLDFADVFQESLCCGRLFLETRPLLASAGLEAKEGQVFIKSQFLLASLHSELASE